MKFINQKFLDARSERAIASGYLKQKWICFCEELLKQGYRLYLYEAQRTFSKYVYVECPDSGEKFKVRFSNHKPNRMKESGGDCDFFVGVTHFGITTTKDALEAVKEWSMRNENNTRTTC